MRETALARSVDRRRARTVRGGMVDSTLRISLAMLFVVASPGCSLIFTHAPAERPPPECATSVAAPVADTVLAAASVALLVAGVAGASTHDPPTCQLFCGTEQALGWGAVIVGAAAGALFTYSAAEGYQRTSACRAWTAPRGQQPWSVVLPDVPLLPALAVEACAQVGDAPRVCPRALLLPGGG
jgi:hypothetical protein